MSVWLRPYLILGLVVTLSGACASSDSGPDEVIDDDDNGEDPPEDDAPTATADASKPRVDAGGKSDAAQDAGKVEPPPSKPDAASDAASADASPAKVDASTDAGPVAMGSGECCDDGNCLCHGPAPTKLTAEAGPFKTANYTISTGTVHYPTDAEPPYAAVALCGGFTNSGPEMADWGPMYASHGIVTVITTTGPLDDPGTRAMKLLATIAELKKENDKSGGQLQGKLAGRYGTSGYSMGGGGTTMASGDDPTLKTSIGLAAWGGTGQKVKVPTLLLCGSSDTVAPCNMSSPVYSAIAEPTPKMMIEIPNTTHFNWFGPLDAGMGTSGKYALAFQKVYLEGDERWKPLLLTKPTSGTMMTNIK